MKSFLNIETSRPGSKGLELFQSLPHHLYPSDCLRFHKGLALPERHLVQCYSFISGNEPVGRFALYANPDLCYEGAQAVALGQYECVDDPGISAQLLHHASQEARRLGASYLIGPMDGSTWDTYRFLDSQQEPLFFTEALHQACYPAQFSQHGFRPIAQYCSRRMTRLQVDAAWLHQLEMYFSNKGIRFRAFNPNDYERELHRIWEFSMKVFAQAFLFTPIDFKSFLSKYRPLQQRLRPELVLMAEDEENGLVGLLFGLHDAYDRNQQQLIYKTLARLSGPRYAGLGKFLFYKLLQKALKLGYSSIMHAFMQLDNPSVRISRHSGAQAYRRYTLYGKKLETS